MRRIGGAADLLAVVVFVVIGRANHHHGESARGLVSTAWPFVAGLAVGWLVLLVRGRAGDSVADGVVVVGCTVAVGMVLRVVAGQGTAVAFIVVALAFLGACMVGWRVALAALRRRRPSG